MTTPDRPYRLEISIEVPGTPDQVWRAIATGSGLSSWMMETELEERVGGTVRFLMGTDADSVGTVTAYDAPRRFAIEEPDWAALAGHEGASVTPMATEFLIESNAGGTCTIRVVSSAFGTGAEWEEEFWENLDKGWRPSFAILRLVLERFPGQVATNLGVDASLDRPQPDVAAAMRKTVFEQGVAGEWIEDNEHFAVLRLTAPVPGFLLLVAYPDEMTTWVRVQGHLFSADAPAYVASSTPAWQAWLDGLAA